MKKLLFLLGLGLVAFHAAAQQPSPFETRKLTDNAYVFRYGGHQALFVVTPAGVIATDPIAFLRPVAATTYLAEIRKITQAPIRYLVYSHHHYDHIAGGKPFKEAGATVIAHVNAKARLEQLKHPDVVIPDVAIGDRHVIELGGVRMELHYTGRNHSDNSLVMILPKDKLAFTVDFITVESVAFRDFPDGFLPDWFESLDKVLALDWERMIGGHPFRGNRFATKDDVRAQKQYMHDLSEAVRVAASQGKCWDAAMKEVKLPQYEKWANYENFLPMNIEKFCNFWGRGYW
jgi:glyoxylase-like metal-dependent hydrolase (beta-lactamase superfamily II)